MISVTNTKLLEDFSVCNVLCHHYFSEKVSLYYKCIRPNAWNWDRTYVNRIWKWNRG